LSSSIFHYASWVIAGKSCQIAVAFFTQLFIARYIAPDELGRFGFLFATLSFWQMLFSLRLPLQVIQSPIPLETPLYLNAAIQEGLFATASLGLPFLLYEPSTDLILLLLATFLWRIAEVMKAFQERQTEHPALLRLESAGQIGANLIALFFAWLTETGYWILILREWLAALFLLFPLFAREKAHFQWRWLTKNDWIQLIQAGRPFWKDGLFEQGMIRLSLICIRVFSGQAIAGHYYQALRFISLPHGHFGSLINRYAFHLFAQAKSSSERRAIYKQIFTFSVIPLGLLSLLAMWKGKELLLFFLGPSWEIATEMAQYMAGGLLFMTLFSLEKMFLLSHVDSHPQLFRARLFQMAGIPWLFLPFPNPSLLGLSFTISYLFAFLSTRHSIYRIKTVESPAI